MKYLVLRAYLPAPFHRAERIVAGSGETPDTTRCKTPRTGAALICRACGATSTGMSGRAVYAVAAILALVAGYACWCRAPLIWDGAYQFNAMLILQRPYVYLTRFHTWFLWWPTVWASRFTGNTMLLQSLFGLPFLLAPVLAVMVSWWVIRPDAPELMLWVVFGVAAGTLPGLIFVINDSIFQQHLFWPVFVGLFVPLTWPKRLVLGALAVFQFAHPIGIALLLGGALAAAGVSVADEAHRPRLLIRAGILALLCALALAKIDITHHIPRLRDTYAEEEASWARAVGHWKYGVQGAVFWGLCCAWLAAALALLASTVRADSTRSKVETRRARRVRIVSFLFAMGAAAFWISWAAHVYWGSAHYRRWVTPLTAPFFILAALEQFLRARRQPRLAAAPKPPLLELPALGYAPRAAAVATRQAAHPRLQGRISPRTSTAPGIAPQSPTDDRASVFPRAAWQFRDWLGAWVAITYAAVLCTQCTIFARLTNRLMRDVRAYPSVVVPDTAAALRWMHDTALNHWATADYVTAVQGKIPKKVLLDWRGEEWIRGHPPRVPHWDFYGPHAIPGAPGPAGWFDFRPLLRQLAKEPPPTTSRSRDQNLESVPN